MNPKTVWQNRNHNLPNLINNPNDTSINKLGGNLFCRDTIGENNEIEGIGFDLIVGNPPFGTTNLSSSIRDYCDKLGFPKEMVLPFLHKAIDFIKPNGKVALIFNTKVLTNTGGTYRNFRRWLFNDCYVDKVYNFSILRKARKDFGGQLFGDATGPISIVHYQKPSPENRSDRIAYYAPKTFIKSTVIDGLSIDFTDLKYLPREECQKPDSKIWKVAMWGSMNDWQLLKSLEGETIGDLLSEKEFKKGLGLQFLDKSTINPKTDYDIPKRYLKPGSIERYRSQMFSDLSDGLTEDSKNLYAKYYRTSPGDLPSINTFRRIGKKEAYEAPHIVMKEGLANWEICSSYVSEDCSFNSKVIGIHHPNPALLKGLVCLLNSKFASYYIFLTSASIGIEREEIKPNEIYDLPLVLDADDLISLSKLYDKYVDATFLEISSNIRTLEQEVDGVIFNKLAEKGFDTFLIEDFISYTLPLLKKNLDAVKSRPNLGQVSSYADTLTYEIDAFLEGQRLFANATVYGINLQSPLMMVKLSFAEEKRKAVKSTERVDEQLKELDKSLWEERAKSIFFRKKLNYKSGNNVYVIRPNQSRFWSQSMAKEDAAELILEILNEN
ncbi:MAG: hypothetical protein Roseis3KO_09230 [Roseivirga sp.]